MYTVYIIFAIVLALSFVTGNIVLIVDHKRNSAKNYSSKNVIFDEEII